MIWVNFILVLAKLKVKKCLVPALEPCQQILVLAFSSLKILLVTVCILYNWTNWWRQADLYLYICILYSEQASGETAKAQREWQRGTKNSMSSHEKLFGVWKYTFAGMYYNFHYLEHSIPTHIFHVLLKWISFVMVHQSHKGLSSHVLNSK